MDDFEADAQRVVLDAQLATVAAAFQPPTWYAEVRRAHGEQEARYRTGGDQERAEVFRRHAPVIEGFGEPPSCSQCVVDGVGSEDEDGRLPVFPCPVLRRTHGSDEVWSSLIALYRSVWSAAASYYLGWSDQWHPPEGSTTSTTEIDNDLGLLHEWQWPGGDWEIITADEVSRRMQQVSTGEAPGPVSHACPPGVLSGMSDEEAIALARAAGLL